MERECPLPPSSVSACTCDERRAIAEAGQRRALAEHTYQHR
ncbi:MAG: glycosyltransferase, partial [Candidatus Kapaibacterium sp.]